MQWRLHPPSLSSLVREGKPNGGTEMGEFVYRDWGGSLPNNWEGERGMERQIPKVQGEEDKTGREGGLRGPMETDEANAGMDVEKVASAQTMSNLEAGAEGSSLAPTQVY